MNAKKYIGRQLRPSQLAAELLPADQQWCTLCHRAVLKSELGAHNTSTSHRLAGKKMRKLKFLSLKAWEEHRGAPLDQESAYEAGIEREFARYREDQQRREQALQQATRGFSRQFPNNF